MLIDEIENVVASVAGSTAAIDFPQLPAFVEQHLYAAQGRADSALQRSQERSANIRQGIQKALGTLSPTWEAHQLAGVVHRRLQTHPSEYGLPSAPSLRTIRGEIDRMQKSGRFGTETTLPLCQDASESTISTSRST